MTGQSPTDTHSQRRPDARRQLQLGPAEPPGPCAGGISRGSESQAPMYLKTRDNSNPNASRYIPVSTPQTEYYVVTRGYEVGVFGLWKRAYKAIDGVNGAITKVFDDLEAAEAWYQDQKTEIVTPQGNPQGQTMPTMTPQDPRSRTTPTEVRQTAPMMDLATPPPRARSLSNWLSEEVAQINPQTQNLIRLMRRRSQSYELLDKPKTPSIKDIESLTRRFKTYNLSFPVDHEQLHRFEEYLMDKFKGTSLNTWPDDNIIEALLESYSLDLRQQIRNLDRVELFTSLESHHLQLVNFAELSVSQARAKLDMDIKDKFKIILSKAPISMARWSDLRTRARQLNLIKSETEWSDILLRKLPSAKLHQDAYARCARGAHPRRINRLGTW